MVTGSGERAGESSEDGVAVSATSTASRAQIPLRHAWALTVHKSQGLTLQPVQVGMPNIGTPGQADVALSRAPSLDQLTILHLNPMVVATSAAVQRLYETPKHNQCDDSERDAR
ncbi:hypothetical protein IOCL2690_000176100 [Leishmania lindenbergi]|uniref:PIF1 helicase-like protein n=1 Tax=Leishmania lindenbergi TaxID=651832 RepID=A0AAW3ATY7_9TRYP